MNKAIEDRGIFAVCPSFYLQFDRLFGIRLLFFFYLRKGRQMKRPFVLFANRRVCVRSNETLYGRYTPRSLYTIHFDLQDAYLFYIVPPGIRILSEIKPEVILALKQTPRRSIRIDVSVADAFDKSRCNRGTRTNVCLHQSPSISKYSGWRAVCFGQVTQSLSNCRDDSIEVSLFACDLQSFAASSTTFHSVT